jgi:hypothetical protein
MLITIATFASSPEAYLWKERLEKAGIPCFIFDEHMAINYSLAVGGVKLKVLEEHAEKALKIIRGENEV